MDGEEARTVKEASRTKRTSLGRECAAYGGSNTFYNSDGSPSGLHIFKFLRTKSKRAVWWNLIKRTDGMDGFYITDPTCLCQMWREITFRCFFSAEIAQHTSLMQQNKG